MCIVAFFLHSLAKKALSEVFSIPSTVDKETSVPVLHVHVTVYFNLMCFAGPLPDYFELIPEKPIIILEGGTGEIVCEAEGVSVTKLQWKKVLSTSVEQPVPDSMVINDKDNAKNLVRATLRIANAQKKDTGDYKCALTAYGKAARKLTSIRVDGKFVLHIMFNN